MKLKLLSPALIKSKYPNSKSGTALLPNDQTIWLPSEALGINWQLGGGIPLGRILELFGYESTGKSLLALNFCKVAHALGGIALWADAEQCFTPDWAETNGLDLSLTEIYDSNDIEGISDWARDMILYYRSRLKANEPIVLVVDSLAALETEANINSDDVEGKAQMGNRAKAIYQMYRKRNHFFAKMGVVVIMINQVRKKLGASMFESNETTPGGDATKFFASQRISLAAGKQIKGKITSRGFKEDTKGVKFGRTVYVGIAKNKVAPPMSNIKTQVHFKPDILGYVGYSKYHGLEDILVMDKVITKKGSWYYYKEHSICQGEDNFLKFLNEEPGKRKIILKNSFVNTISKTRDKMEKIEHNLFPVKMKQIKEDDDE